MIFQDHREANDFIILGNFLPAAVTGGLFNAKLFAQPGLSRNSVDAVPIRTIAAGQPIFFTDRFMRNIDLIVNRQRAAADGRRDNCLIQYAAAVKNIRSDIQRQDVAGNSADQLGCGIGMVKRFNTGMNIVIMIRTKHMHELGFGAVGERREFTSDFSR